jgi:hypothetical protein
MELSGEEKKLQALFSELKSADEATAPRFARLWNHATPGTRRGFVFNPALVTAMALLGCAVVSFALWSRYRPQVQTPPVARVETPAVPNMPKPTVSPTVDTAAASATNPLKENTIVRRKPTTVRRNSIQLATNRKLTQDAKAITDWESPTSALLTSPSDSLFSSLPQLNENANGLRSFLPSRPN